MEVSGPDRPYLELARHVLSLSRTIRRYTDPLLREHHDIGGHDLFVLRAVERGESNPMRLAEHLDIPPSSASRLLDRLVESGLLARADDPDDRRKTRLSLTDRGRSTADDARQLLEEILSAALSHVPEEKIHAATDVVAGLSLDFGATVHSARPAAGRSSDAATNPQ